MALRQIDLTLTVDRPLPEAQDRVLDAVDPGLRDRGFAPRATGGTVDYRVKAFWPIIVWAVRRMRGEHVSFTFEERASATQVRVAGRLPDSAYAELTEALSSYTGTGRDAAR